MADYINNVAAGDNYTPGCTIGPNFAAKAVVLTIANNPALMQFAVGVAGEWHWTDEREYFSIPQSFRVGNVIGVKVRNANPGQVARVLATLSGDDDPDFQSGLPFTGVLTPSGAIVGAAGLTGKIQGSTGNVLAGTGFTCVRNAVGVYTITFTTPFAAPPLILVTSAENDSVSSGSTVVSVNSVTVNNAVIHGVDPPSRGAGDVDFYFTAQPVQ